jgi:hypothetical protein
MLRFYRSLPRIVLVEPFDFVQFDNFMKELPCFRQTFKVSIGAEFQRQSNFDELSERSILVYTVEKLTEESVDRGYRSAYILEVDIESFMMAIMNDERRLVMHIRQSPQMMVMKTVGNIEKVVDKLVKDLNGESVEFSQMLRGKSKGAYLCLTKENVDHTLMFKDFYSHSIYTEMSFRELKEYIAHYSLKYVNVGLENKDWYELSIKIYDSYGRFKEQYDRLTYVIDLLNMGLIAGESWGTDAATVFLSVGIYKVKLMTFFKPEEIKRMLVALEYDLNGNRMVDFDLFYRKRKIHWDCLKTKEVFKKIPVGIEARKYLISQMTDEQFNILKKMEKELQVS